MEKVRYIGQNTRLTPNKILGLLLLVLIAGGILAITLRNPQDSTQSGNQVEEELPAEPLANQALLYGNWAGDNSQIFAFDLATRQEYVVATLPINIKKVTMLDDNTLLFINNTDAKDHGKELALYNITDDTTTPVYTADIGFGIDDYVISPDKSRVAVWEVQFAQNNALRGGQSRVYTTSLNSPNPKNQIANEAANSPVLYPLAITDSGEVFMDRFLPNTGAGWAYGMSVSDFTGTQVTPLENMQAGSYGTQPKLSVDGQYLLFGGYNGQLGSGDDQARGYRRALLSTNTVELLDTGTKERIQLPLPTENIYSDVLWEENGEIKLTILAKDPENTGVFLYNIDTQTLTNAVSEENFTFDRQLIADLGNGIKINGKIDSTSDFLGNLGNTYAPPYSDMTITVNEQEYDLPVSVSLGQIIGVVPSSNINTRQLATTEDATGGDNPQIRLNSFEIKEQLEEKRSGQQSEIRPTATPPPSEIPEPTQAPVKLPRCRELNSIQCNELLNANYTPDQAFTIRRDWILQQKAPKESRSMSDKMFAYGKCMQTQLIAGYKYDTCSDSPLYLYGPQGLEVDVRIHTPIFNENIKPLSLLPTPYSPHPVQYTFTLGKKGLFSSQGKSYQSLSFDYTPAVRVRPPIAGTVVRRSEVENVVRDYAQKLGLNQRETHDTVQDITAKAKGQYVFLSFYSQEVSKYLLPISFSPRPDTYINYVFYVDNLKSRDELGHTPQEPEFEKIEKRGELTAVEISVISD